MAFLRFFLLCFLAFTPLKAQEIIVGFSQTRISITADFDGSNVLLFGAIKYFGQPPTEQTDMIITLSGPEEAVQVREKERRYGIWVNSKSVRIDKAPSFYSIATTRPLNMILSETEDLRHKISLKRLVRVLGGTSEAENPEIFAESLVRLRQEGQHYGRSEETVHLQRDVLFETKFNIPANIVEGDYQARIFLIKDKAVVQHATIIVPVRKVGFERWVYTAAMEQPFLYGILSLIFALAMGWVANEIFRRYF